MQLFYCICPLSVDGIETCRCRRVANWSNEYLSTGLVQANDMSNLLLALCGDTMCFLVGLYLAMYLYL